MSSLRSYALAMCIVLHSVPAAFAQNPIPNPGFENWAGSQPVGWQSSEIVFTGSAVPSASAHSGALALELNVVEIPPNIVVPPSVQSEVYPGFPVSQQWAALRGYYDFTGVDGDLFFITVSMFKGGVPMASGFFGDSVGTNGYTEFVAPIVYPFDSIPDTAYIQALVTFTGVSGQTHLGTTVLLDDFEFSMDTTLGSGGSCPITLTGDVNLSGAVNPTDIVYMVNNILKPGPASLPCEAAGDVNCSGTLSTSDIIYLVNTVFKGGPAPCDACSLVPGTWPCP